MQLGGRWREGSEGHGGQRGALGMRARKRGGAACASEPATGLSQRALVLQWAVAELLDWPQG